MASHARSLRIDGLDFHVRVTADGPPLVLLHGFPDSGELWRYQSGPLAAAIARTVQWVPPSGGSASCVRRITSATFSSASFGIRDGRVLSRNRPSTPAAT